MGSAQATGFYRFEAKIISRGGGRSLIAAAAYRTGGKSATSAAAYRAGDVLTDERTGETFDYTRKRGIRGAEIMLPAGAPAWMNDRQKLWNAVEAAEKRKDAQTARDYLLSIPHQLSPEQRRALVKWFVAQQFVAKGFPADVAFHGPDAREGLNHHAHVMVTMRRVEGDGFARTKDRAPAGTHPLKAWKDELMQLREAWATAANRFLEAAGLDIRITHESLQTRGIDREPDPKLGPVAMQIEAAGRDSHAGNDRREVAERNALRTELAIEHAQAVAAEAQLVNLMAERVRRGAMDENAAEKAARDIPDQVQEVVDKIRAADAAARATLLREAEQTVQRVEALKTQAQRDEEQAKRDRDQAAEAERIRWRDGKISSAEARYSIALGDTAGIDPLTNLVRAAGAESAAFMRNQEALRGQLADPKLSADQKREIQFRKDIEFYEYNALANTRVAGLYEAIGGKEHMVQGGYRDLLSTEQTEAAQKLRKERGAFLDALRQREKDDVAAKVQGYVRSVDKDPPAPRGAAKGPATQTSAAMEQYLGTKPGQSAPLPTPAAAHGQQPVPAPGRPQQMQQTQEPIPQQPAQQPTQPTGGQAPAAPPAQAPAQPGQEQGQVQQPATRNPRPAQAQSRPEQRPQNAGRPQQTSGEMAAYLSGTSPATSVPATAAETKDTPGREQTDARQASARRSAGREITDGERERIANRHNSENQSLDQAAQHGKGQDRGRGR